MNSEISLRLEAARKELLDLGLRNPLLNFRSRTRRIDVVDELAAEVFRILVAEGRKMTFAALPGAQDDESGDLLQLFGDEDPDWTKYFAEASEAEVDGVAERHVDRVLQTRLEKKALHARLLSIHRDARTLLEEQGVNILYLAIGFLHWYEDNSDKERIAPLVLVPVELERGSVAENFKLTYSGEEIGENLSLLEKLRSEFSISLPTIKDSEDFDLVGYLSSVESKTARQPRWRVAPDEMLLGFFSYGKFLMYKDLAPDAWPEDSPPSSHEILAPLLGDGFSEPPLVDGDQTNIDELVGPGDLHQVLDADSSQALAILDVAGGRNMVVQGPPGTGKSQTIANVIANAIGSGKKVLFVSEKMAALEVVKRRLDKTGLGDAVLELHSHKTRKRAVLDEIRRTLDAGRPKVANVTDDMKALTALRDRLNSYSEAINAPILNSGVSPNAAIGRLNQLGSDAAELPRMDFSVMREWSQATYREQRLRIEELQKRLGPLGVPKQSIFWGARIRVLLPTDENPIRAQVAELRRTAIAVLEQSRRLADVLNLRAPDNLPAAARVCRAGQWVLKAPDLSGIAVSESDWKDRREDIGEVTKTGAAWRDLKDRFDEILIEEAWDQDLLRERQWFAAYGDKWWRFLSAKYRAAKSRLRGLVKGELPRRPSECLDLIETVLSGRRMRKVCDEFESAGARLFGAQWRGTRSNWEDLAALATWLADTHTAVEEGKLPKELLASLENNPSTDGLNEAVRHLARGISAAATQLKALESRLEWTPTGGIASRSLAATADLMEKWLAEWESLRLLASFNAFAEEIKARDLSSVLALAESWEHGSTDLVRSFDVTWYEGLLKVAYEERKILAQFDRTSHEHALETFRSLDKQLFTHNCIRLAAAHWAGLPATGHGGEVGIIQTELNKKRRHLPIRQLVGSAGRALQAIKPVFMMSPLSIANFLPPGSVTFDLVVFDEASQVKPVDAFGAILRGRQVVVVGDSKQLPPTSFFDSLVADDVSEEVETSVTQNIESILSVFLAKDAPQRMLRWHYRSQHESLIAVSNHEFYDDKLVVFPSPDYGRDALGLRFHLLSEMPYDRGRSRTNPGEARAVAERVMEYARQYPELTMGVAAFSTAQRDAISFQLELMRRRDLSAEDYFSAHPEEPFFVKNLENVQGDERDVILISIGYGKNEQGYLAMGFGPLNQDGGERRLNVLITRARRICDVFANFTADDLDLQRSRARGVAALKTFLKYAADGTIDVPRPTGAPTDSPFEDSVLRALEAQGYQVHPQVGAGGFRIDLGVVDDEKPGRYLLGIECDGAAYHSARSARDRDRIREEVLRSLGWRIHRIWSTDWFRDPETETRRAAEAIERARAHWSGIGRGGSRAQTKGGSQTATVIPRSNIRANDKEAPRAEPYVVADVRIRLNQRELHEVPKQELSGYVFRVVEQEAPIHVDQIIARITAAAGLQRAGNRIRQALETAISQACWNKQAVKRGKFLYLAQGKITARDRSDLPQQAKRIDYIAPEEILVAVGAVVKGAFRISIDEAVVDSCRLLGFQRVTSGMSDAVSKLAKKHCASFGVECKGEELVWMGVSA